MLMLLAALAAPPTAETFDGSAPAAFDFLLSLPKDYEDSRETYPLVLFLHGAGERGDDVQAVAKHGPPKLAKAGREFPFILVAPQCAEGRWWQPTEVLALLDHVEATHRVDTSRVYLTGLSMGGFGTWETAGLAPERFAAAAPVCGGGTPMVVRNLAGLPIWAFHGEEDAVVPPEFSGRLVAAVNRQGGDAKLTLYPGVGHDSWTQTYDDPEFWEWLLSQKKGS